MGGCKSTENNERELYNEDVNTRHRFLFGVHISKDPEGIEGNIQLACGAIKKKKYERVPPVTNTGEQPTQQLAGNPQAPAQQIAEHSHGNG